MRPCDRCVQVWSAFTQARLDIRSYIDTPAKHGQDLPTARRAAMTRTR